MNTPAIRAAYFLLMTAWPAICLAVTHYVDDNSANPVPPFTNEATASTDIQSAVDEASTGDTILVSDGTYIAPTQIMINKAVTVRSVNGSAVTIIEGEELRRCLWLDHTNAVVDGFTISRGGEANGNVGVGVNIFAGMVQNCSIVSNSGGYGGGVSCSGGTISNCYIGGNYASWVGGGVQVSGSGMIVDSVISDNSSYNSGGGIHAEGGLVLGCIIRNNTSIYGGGSFLIGGAIHNCLINGNSASYGGGVYTCVGTLKSCTIISNNASSGGGIYDDMFGLTLSIENSIIYYNTPDNTHFVNSPLGSVFFSHCCTWPLETNGIGNIDAEPLFAPGTANGYHLTALSPCIDTGTNEEWMTTSKDIDGQLRIFNNQVDIGADEACIASTTITGTGVYTLKWDTIVGATCQLQKADAVASSSWTDILAQVVSTGQTLTLIVSNTNDSIHFYRLKWIR